MRKYGMFCIEFKCLYNVKRIKFTPIKEIVFLLQQLVGGQSIINTQVIKGNQLIISNHYLLNDHINLEIPKDLGTVDEFRPSPFANEHDF